MKKLLFICDINDCLTNNKNYSDYRLKVLRLASKLLELKNALKVDLVEFSMFALEEDESYMAFFVTLVKPIMDENGIRMGRMGYNNGYIENYEYHLYNRSDFDENNKVKEISDYVNSCKSASRVIYATSNFDKNIFRGALNYETGYRVPIQILKVNADYNSVGFITTVMGRNITSLTRGIDYIINPKQVDFDNKTFFDEEKGKVFKLGVMRNYDK